ncbi:MAG: hypothetical protein JNK01_08555 [Devosia sp.]|nr:hypothetical protein [Devosia sp.]
MDTPRPLEKIAGVVDIAVVEFDVERNDVELIQLFEASVIASALLRGENHHIRARLGKRLG